MISQVYTDGGAMPKCDHVTSPSALVFINSGVMWGIKIRPSRWEPWLYSNRCVADETDDASSEVF